MERTRIYRCGRAFSRTDIRNKGVRDVISFLGRGKTRGIKLLKGRIRIEKSVGELVLI